MNGEKTCVYINLDTVPFTADLVFPKGISQGGHVSLIFGTFDEFKAKTHPGSAEEFARMLGKKFRVQSPVVKGVPQCFIRISLQSATANCQDAEKDSDTDTEEEVCAEDKNTGRQRELEHLPGSTEVQKDGLSSSCSESLSLSDGDNESASVSDDDVEEKEFLCYKCSASFESTAERRDHISTQHNTVRACPFCPRKFLEKYALVRHMWSHLPPSVMPFRCADCKEPFLSKKELLLHKTNPHKQDMHAKASEGLPTDGIDSKSATQEVFICEFCSDAFLTHRGYKQHLNRCHKEEGTSAESSTEQRCTFCDSYVAPNFKHLCLHLSEKHPEANVFPCRKCSLVFTDRSEVQKHESTHTVRVTFNNNALGGKEYHCNICKELLASSNALLTHIRLHSVDPDAANHVCDVCYGLFQSRSQLRNHVRKQHRPQPGGNLPVALICPECRKSFMRSSLLKRHCKAVHDRLLSHACTRCPKRFSTERQRQRHLAIVHRSEMTEDELHSLTLIQRYVCEECAYSTYSSKTIRRHVYGHTGQFPHVCDECGRGFVFRFELTTHRSRDHRHERYTCERCPRAFYSHDRFERHISAHDGGWGFACPTCGQLYETQGYLESHQLIHSEQRPYECSKCGKRFKTPQGLTFHNVGYHQSRSYVRNAEHWQYRCYECDISFKYMSSLHAHNACHHVHQEQRLECQYCSVKFSSKMTLSQHIRNHTREKVVHQCGECKKTFGSYSTLKRHKIINHARKQNAVCPICGKSCTSEWNLRQHVKSCRTDEATQNGQVTSEPVQEVMIQVSDGSLGNESKLSGVETFMVELPYNTALQ